VALGVPGRLRPWKISTFGTTRVVGRQPYAPAAFTPGEISGTHFQRLSWPQGTWFCRKEPQKKSPVKPPGIDPRTIRLVAQWTWIVKKLIRSKVKHKVLTAEFVINVQNEHTLLQTHPSTYMNNCITYINSSCLTCTIQNVMQQCIIILPISAGTPVCQVLPQIKI
jgi:hypothetical protein